MRALLITVLLTLAAPCLAAPKSFLMVVAGVGGEPAYSERFAAWTETLLDAARSRMAIPRDRIVHLAEHYSVGIDGPSTKAELANAIETLASRAEPDDTIFLILIGHGTARGDRVLFNLPGPDVSTVELDGMISPYSALNWVIVNTTPASGPFIEALSGPNRVVVTATANAAERFHTVFAEFFVAAYAENGADTDKNGRISVLEAYEFARREVQRRYEENGTLQSEHAALGDSADLARTTYLESDRTRYASSLPADELERLLSERDGLEQRIEFLISEKETLDPVAYDDRLEGLLIEFALIHRALRAPETAQ